ncbi:hypothetical protein KI387_006668, partial [Taxus chinensis]
RYTLVLGINKWEEIPGGVLVVKIYDSEGDEWTTFHTINALSSAPTGEGVFSGGSFYWVSVTVVDESQHPWDSATRSFETPS